MSDGAIRSITNFFGSGRSAIALNAISTSLKIDIAYESKALTSSDCVFSRIGDVAIPITVISHMRKIGEGCVPLLFFEVSSIRRNKEKTAKNLAS